MNRKAGRSRWRNTPPESSSNLHSEVATALEAARVEVLRRLSERRLPLSFQTSELHIVPNDGGGGWRSEYRDTNVNSFRLPNMAIALRDDSVQFATIGLRPQLEPLAQLLSEMTDLGTRPANFLPDFTGTEAILARYLTRMAHEYLSSLDDLRVSDPALVTRLAADLDELIEPDGVRHTKQMAIEGVTIESPLEHRDIRLRPLSTLERGYYWQSQNANLFNPFRQQTDFVVPHEFIMITPSALLETTTSRPRTEPSDQSTLANRVALAFYLKGFDIASTGVLVGLDRPVWATLGQSHGRSLVDEKSIPNMRTIERADFEAIVDLAYKMPDFGSAESSNEEVALYRLVRGLGTHWLESGFLDFAIALEAALLKGAQTELSYRFALYGALYLHNERKPEETFEQLRNVYDVRSKLVHGSSIKTEKRDQAIRDAPEIAKAVVLRAIETGWPDARSLDRYALIRHEWLTTTSDNAKG